MQRPTDVRIVDVQSTAVDIPYRTPMKFGGRVVTAARIWETTVTVETRLGLRGVGRGAMPLSNAWSWPSQSVNGQQTLAAMCKFADACEQAARTLPDVAHPLELSRSLAAGHAAAASSIERELTLAEPIPPLAQLVATSPLEAALHDAYGQALARNSYDVLGREFVNFDLARYLSADFQGDYLDQYTLRSPQPRLPLYHLVGALDPLTSQDITSPLHDGLPQTLGEWITADGLTHLKIKLAGDDLAWDVDRVCGVEAVAQLTQAARGCARWVYSLDFNEKCASVEYLLDFLAQLQQRSPAALERVQYIEQPTHRDLRAHRENRMHRAAQIKPIVIDESLVDYESLLLCREQGYTGVALKACKGHSEALLMGAAAQKFGMFLCVQDLTCPGRSFLHSASLAARIPGVAAIEGNARQYCPAGNAGWTERWPQVFQVSEGSIETGVLSGVGLGYG